MRAKCARKIDRQTENQMEKDGFVEEKEEKERSRVSEKKREIYRWG